MADSSTPVETNEQKAAREAQERALAAQATSQNDPKESSIWEAIRGFFTFLFQIFFPGNDAPNEEPEPAARPQETPADRLRLGQLIVEKRAIPKWEEFQRAHANERVAFQSPVAGQAVVTSNFGHREAPTKGASTEHKGVDIGARGGVSNPDILASASGVVLFSGRKQGYGNTVILGHADGSYTLYGHLRGEKMPEIGAEVMRGATIGVMGATGTADGIHLHYEQRKGENALAPKLEGVTLAKGMEVRPQTSSLASLADPRKHPKLAVAHGGHPSAPALAGAGGYAAAGRT